MSLRTRLKKKFDRVVFRYPSLNWVLRNLNKRLSFLTSFRLRPFGTITVRYNSGLSFRMATNETSSVTKLLFWRGPDNYEYTSIFEKLVPHCNTFLDIGANTGYYALLAAVRNPSARIFAFEPASAPYHYLTENIRINSLHTIEALPMALSDRSGEIEFFEVDNPENYHNKYNLAGTGTLIGEDMANQRFVRRKVPTTTLDAWIETRKLEKVDLVKVDTEGTENLILLGADRMLKEQQPIVICEILFHVIEDKLEQIMRRYDYRFFNYRNGQLHETPSLIRETDNGFRDCFFVPSGKVDWIKPFIAAL